MCSLPVWSFVTIRFASLINLPTSSSNAINASRSWKLHDSAVSDQIHFLFFSFFFSLSVLFRLTRTSTPLVSDKDRSYSRNSRAQIARPFRFTIVRFRDCIEERSSKTLFLISAPSFSRFYGTYAIETGIRVGAIVSWSVCSGFRPRIYTYLTRRWVIKYYGTWKGRMKSYVQRKRRVR